MLTFDDLFTGGPLAEELRLNYMKRKNDGSTKRPAKKQNTSISPSLKQAVDREVRKELSKRVDWRVTDAVGTGNLNLTGAILDCQVNLARGDLDLNNFTGNSIFPKWLQVGWKVSNTATTTTSETFRIVVGQQIKASATPTIANLFQVQTAGYASICPFNNDYTSAFKILYDEWNHLGNYESGSLSNCKSGKIFINGNRLRQIDFIAANSIPLTGGLFVAIIGDTSSGTLPTFNVYSRIKFRSD